MKYENHYYVSKKMYKEYVNKVLCYKIYLIGAMVCTLSFCDIVLKGIMGEYDHIKFPAVCLAVVLICVIAIPRIILLQLMNYANKLNKGENPECIVCFDSNIRIKQGNIAMEVEYDNIVAWYKLKTCNILMITNQNGIMYTSDGFLGDSSDFDEFIKSKCKCLKSIVSR